MENPTVVVWPPTILDPGVKQVIFLAGPIQGAPDWQDVAIGWFKAHTNGLVIASPRTPGPGWHGDYNGQVDWETFHLRRAAQTGMILFWLACPDPPSKWTNFVQAIKLWKPKRIPRAYAQTSRFELGEWIGSIPCRSRPAIALGIEDGFTNERYIRRRLEQDHPGITIHNYLIDTCEWALENMPPF